MRMLKPSITEEAFFKRVASAPRRALLLDYDGTLAPFRVKRDTAVPYPGVREALEELMAEGHSRVVVISGRATADLLPLLGLRHPPELWGTHGWEHRSPEGRYVLEPLPPPAAAAFEALAAEMEARHDPEHWERKPASLAVHFRGLAPDCAQKLSDAMLRFWDSLPDRSALELLPFEGGLELRAAGRHKGDAVRTVLEAMGADTAAAYLGDDLTDEDAFAAIAGKGLAVLVRAERRETAAEWWLRPPEELLWFLERWREASGRSR